ncbi:polysaccharide deacetylase family protein [Lacticaseibacillus absianus]|uniref:polysaccharide deacetylase family protein n=1 Tax=Lacticaseibacillus absianus TaxID=2729623 RepID=UPI001FEC46C3|nr:polysaccharide deacetylase family protein [Lacticaseibacillus absianus]
MRQARRKNNRWYGWAIGLLVILVGAGGFGAWQLGAMSRKAAAPNALRSAIKTAKTKHSDGHAVTVKGKGGTVVYLLPRNQTQPSAALRTQAQAALPASGRQRTVVASVAATNGPMGLTALRATFTGYSIVHDQLRVTKHAAKGVGVVDAGGHAATIANLVPDDYTRRAVNYAAKQVLVEQHKQTPDTLAQVLAMPLLASMTATNFHLDKSALGITDAAGKTLVSVPLSRIAPYLRDGGATATSGKVVALTFDDGPNPTTTPKVLKALADAQVKATFFMVGTGLRDFPTTAKAVAAAGHEVGIHTYDHKFLPGLSHAEAMDEIYGKMTQVYYDVFGKLPTLLRPPYGAISKPIADAEDLPAIQWTTDSQDWESRNATAILNRVSATTYDGGIVLMHDIQPATVQALPNVLRALKAKGYRFVTVSELLGGRLLPGHQYFGRGDERLVSNAK